MSQAPRDQPLLHVGPLAPWHATVTVTPVRLERGRHTATPSDTSFEILCAWTGPPPVHSQPSERPVAAQDVYHEADPILAKQIAESAAAKLGAAEVPDLPQIAVNLRALLAPE
jgi:hypothetical protein